MVFISRTTTQSPSIFFIETRLITMNEIFDDLFYHRRDIKLSSILFLYFEAMMSVKENSRKHSTLKHFPFNNLE